MPIQLNVLKKLDESNCYVSTPAVNTLKMIDYLQENKDTAYTITDVLQLLKEQQDDLTIPEVNKVKFNKSMIYNALNKLAKDKASPIKKKGSYFWFD
ncbi:hypothetical protein LCGC14_0589100 [marine sediment metagenome]|uniref:Uncharacterized protein n=1 Tax=marine sediment metagenome TaxID=412755 RepID=A0A0F9UMC3_9ZZZZ